MWISMKLINLDMGYFWTTIHASEKCVTCDMFSCMHLQKWRIKPNLPMSSTVLVQVSFATNRTMDALKTAQKSLHSEKIKITSANASNPGIPPSSLMSFLKKVFNITLVIFLFPC